jgi:hypothetical protein
LHVIGQKEDQLGGIGRHEVGESATNYDVVGGGIAECIRPLNP